jgi:hypothetical protein
MATSSMSPGYVWLSTCALGSGQAISMATRRPLLDRNRSTLSPERRPEQPVAWPPTGGPATPMPNSRPREDHCSTSSYRAGGTVMNCYCFCLWTCVVIFFGSNLYCSCVKSNGLLMFLLPVTIFVCQLIFNFVMTCILQIVHSWANRSFISSSSLSWNWSQKICQMVSKTILFLVRNVSRLNLKYFWFLMNLKPYQTGPKAGRRMTTFILPRSWIDFWRSPFSHVLRHHFSPLLTCPILWSFDFLYGDHKYIKACQRMAAFILPLRQEIVVCWIHFWRLSFSRVLRHHLSSLLICLALWSFDFIHCDHKRERERGANCYASTISMQARTSSRLLDIWRWLKN